MTASFEVALQIAKHKNLIGETLVKSCALNVVKLILGETNAKKIYQVSLSNNTIKRGISLMATDVKQQVIAEIKSSPMFFIQVDESTDVASCLQLLIFIEITEQLNKFNLRLQGPYTNILQFGDIFFGFIEKVHNWNRRVNQENFAMFDHLSERRSGLSSLIKQEIT